MADTRHRTHGAVAGWRVVAHITSALVVAGTAAVAVSSRTIGRPTWWLGPSSNPASPLWIALPVVLVSLPVVVHVMKSRFAPVVSVACCLGLAVVALGDVGDSSAVALGFAVVAVAGALAHGAVWLGLRQYR